MKLTFVFLFLLIGGTYCRTRYIQCNIKTGPELNARSLKSWRYGTSGHMLSCPKASNRGASRCHGPALEFVKSQPNLAMACGSSTERSPSNPIKLYKFSKADCTGVPTSAPYHGAYSSSLMFKICCIQARAECKGASVTLRKSSVCGSSAQFLKDKVELDDQAFTACCRKRFPDLSGIQLFRACFS